MNPADPLPRRDDGAPPPQAGAEGLFLFGFMPWADGLALPAGMQEAEVDGAMVLHREGDLLALAGRVRLADYCGPESEGHLADVAWLTPRLRRHAAAVSWAMVHSAVFPVPFGALCESRDSLGAFMRSHAATIRSFLAQVRGKQEWELRLTLDIDGPGALEAFARAVWPEWDELSPGIRYMRLRRDRENLVLQAQLAADEWADDLVADLDPLVAAARPLPAKLEDGTQLVTRRALLVAEADADALAAALGAAGRAAERPSVGVYVSGPWPPFSFRPSLGPG